MTTYAVRAFVAGDKDAFDLKARNTLTGETRVLTVYASDAVAAYDLGFKALDKESGDRSWVFDGYERRDT